MLVADIIESKLRAALAPEHLVIKDESHLHHGHSGAPEGGQSHFRVTIVAAFFDGQNRVARQRKINQILAEELAGPIHALAMTTLSPAEWAAQSKDA